MSHKYTDKGDFMNRIKELRKENNMTQADLAKILNVTDRSVGFYENEKRDPDTDTLKTLANLFNVSIDYLLGRTENKKTNDIKIALNSISTDGLDADDIDMVKGIIENLKKKNKNKK